jgi:hypothetical protein
MAVDSLMNSQQIIHSEEKCESPTTPKYTFPAELLATLKGIFSQQSHYDFPMHYNLTGQTSGAGALTNNLAWSPGVITYAEYACLQALFSEVKIIQSRVHWTTAFPPSALTSGIATQFALGPNNILNGTSPSGYNLVQRLAESVVFSSHSPGPTGGLTLTKSHRVPSRPYSPTDAPAQITPMAGCVGQWSYAMNIAGTVSVNYFFVAMTNTYRFRSRQ